MYKFRLALATEEEGGDGGRDENRGVFAALDAAKARIGKVDRNVWVRESRGGNPNEKCAAAVSVAVGAKLVTRGEAKMVELLRDFPHLLPSRTSTTTSGTTVHVSDAPGGFISAVARKWEERGRRGGAHQWWAMSLRGVPGALSYHPRIQRSKNGHIVWGEDGTGDVTNAANVARLAEDVREATQGQGAVLVTADGGFHLDDPGQQATAVAPLIEGEVEAILQCGGTGGAAVLKVFELRDGRTRAALARLVAAFDSVHLTKPRTSRPCNSERYVVCIGRRPPPPPTTPPPTTPPRLDRSFETAEAHFARTQTSAIERVLRRIDGGGSIESAAAPYDRRRPPRHVRYFKR